MPRADVKQIHPDIAANTTKNYAIRTDGLIHMASNEKIFVRNMPKRVQKTRISREAFGFLLNYREDGETLGDAIDSLIDEHLMEWGTDETGRTLAEWFEKNYPPLEIPEDELSR